ncbi:MAG: hypothetical protein KC457_15035, partial [Myxococcales bacterium]|nr:hypothetical protein [Myxococcales bacterium]
PEPSKAASSVAKAESSAASKAAASTPAPSKPAPAPAAVAESDAPIIRRKRIDPEQAPALDAILHRSPPDYLARARVLQDMLSDLGCSEEQLPDDGEKQRKAARIGAKRRLAVIDKEHPELDLDDLESEAAALLRELFEYGPLTEAVADPTVCEMLIRGPHQVWITRGSERERMPAGFSGPEAVAMTIRRLAGFPIRWNTNAPWLDLHLQAGLRIRGAHASAAPGGPVVVIERPPAARSGGLVDLVADGVLPPALAELLVSALKARGSVLIGLEDDADGAPLLSALAHELAHIDPARLAVVRTGARIAPPSGAVVLDAEPGVTAAPIRMALDVGASRLLVHRAEGSGLASVWSGLERGLGQIVLSVGASTPAAARSACIDGLVLGGFGRERELLAGLVGGSFDLLIMVAARADGGDVVVNVAEFDDRGQVRSLLSRAAPDAPWRYHADPAFVTEMARRGGTFDPARLAALAQP